MIYVSDTPGGRNAEPVERANVIALAAAIERGDREDAFHQMAGLLDGDSECLEWIEQGRRAPARPGTRMAAAA